MVLGQCISNFLKSFKDKEEKVERKENRPTPHTVH